jgi:hypothetical protein
MINAFHSKEEGGDLRDAAVTGYNYADVNQISVLNNTQLFANNMMPSLRG